MLPHRCPLLFVQGKRSGLRSFIPDGTAYWGMTASRDLLASGVCFCGFTRAIEDVGVNEADLRGREVLREGGHAELAASAASNDFLEHLVFWLFCITQVGDSAAAHYVSAAAASSKR